MEDASSPYERFVVLDIETRQDPTAFSLAGGGKGWRLGLERISAFALLTSSPAGDERVRSLELLSHESEDEHQLLLSLDDALTDCQSSKRAFTLVTYNGLGFDLGVIRRRAARHWLFDLPLTGMLADADHLDLMVRHTRSRKDRLPSLRDACAGLGIPADPHLASPRSVELGAAARKAETDVVATYLLFLYEMAIKARAHGVLYEGWLALERMVAERKRRGPEPHLEQFLRHAHFRAMKARAGRE